MTKYFQMNLKTLLKNPYLLFWSILFIEFWVFMWAYVFGAYTQLNEEAIRRYLAAAYGNLLMLSLSGAAITIANGLLYASKSIRFITKYTKLSPSRFILENLLSSLIGLMIISGVMFVSVMIVFYTKFGMLILPVNFGGLLFGILLSTLFIYVLSLFLNMLIVILRTPKSASFIAFLPIIFAFTAYSALWIDFGIIAYLSPFNCIVSICYYFFSGEKPPTGDYFTPGEKNLVNINYTLASLAIWLAFLIIVNALLLKKMRGIGIEEIRTA